MTATLTNPPARLEFTGSNQSIPGFGPDDEETRRAQAIQAELGPRTELGRILARRVATLSLRLERAERHEAAMVASQVREAEARHVDDRLTRVEDLVRLLPSESSTVARRLREMPEGIDWLLSQLDELTSDLLHEGREHWTMMHKTRLECLLGLDPASYRKSRLTILSEAALGFLNNLEPLDAPGLTDPARSTWARHEIARRIAAEAATLKNLRAAIDPIPLDRARKEAADRALFDPAPERVLARKYEAATERGLYRALKELRLVEAEASQIAPVATEPPAELASFSEPESTEPRGEETNASQTLERPVPRPGSRRPLPLRDGKRRSGVQLDR